MVRQKHIHVFFKNFLNIWAKINIRYGWARSYLCIGQNCLVQLDKNILIYLSKVSHMVKQEYTHISFKNILYSKIKRYLYMLQ